MALLRYEIELTDDELRTAWLTEERARRGLVRRAIPPALVVFGVATIASRADGTSRLLAATAIALGLFQLARPFLAVARAVAERRGRSGRVVVTFDESGVAVSRDGKTARFAWTDVTAAGERETYLWYELRGRHRAPIPRRAIEDLDALRALLRARTRWVP